jgi:branched-chain amino acid transport system permease protein
MNIAGFISTIYTQRKLTILAVLLVILAIIATLPLYSTKGTVVTLTEFFVYIILSVGWVMFCGPTGYMSLATAAFFGIGIYASALLFSGKGVLLPLPAVAVVGGLAASCFALLVGSATLRLRGIYFAIFTFGLVELGWHLIHFLELRIGGTRGRLVAAFDANNVFYLMLIVLVATLVTAYLIRRSRYGLALQNIGGNEEAAAHMGVNTTKVKILTFALSAFFMGVAGSIIAPNWSYIDATVAFDARFTFLPVLMVLVGGMGELYGPVIGALAFSYLRYTLLTRVPLQYMLILGATLVVVITFLPGGLVSLIQKLQNKLAPKLRNKLPKLLLPLPEPGKERTWRPTAAGILSIIGGVAQLPGGIVFAVAAQSTGSLVGLTGIEFIDGFIGRLSGFYAIIAAVIFVVVVIAILGGIFASARRLWGLALAGSICALLGPGVIFGIPAIIFVILGKGEFQYGMMEGGKGEQHAHT